MSDFGKYVNRLPPGTDPALGRALADVFRDIVEDKSPLERKLDKIVFASDYGAKGDGTTDDTAAIQAAIDASRCVFFPPGTYRIAGTLAMTVAGGHVGQALIGAGVGATTLYFDNGSSNCITVAGTDTGASQFNGFTLRDMTLSHGTKTGGRTIVISYAYKALLQNLLLNNCWCGIEGYVTNNLDLYNVNIQGILGGGGVPAHLGPAGQAPENCYGLFWHAPSDGTYRSDALRTINVTVQAIFSGADGFLWDGAATTWDAYQCTALACNYGLRVRNTGASNANYPQFGEFTNFNTDGAMTQGMRIEAGATFHFQGCNFSNTSGSTDQGNADTNAVEVLPDESGSFTRHLSFVNCGFQNCRQDAAKISARDVLISNCAFYDGGKASSNTYSGLVIGADAEDVIVNGNRFSQYGANNNWKHGITVLAGSVRVMVAHNFIYNAQTLPISWLNTDAYSRCYGNGNTFALVSDEAVYKNNNQVSLTAGNVTLTHEQLLGGLVEFTGTPGATRTVTVPTAANIVSRWQNPATGQTLSVLFMNNSNGRADIAGNTGTSVNGTTVTGVLQVAAGASREIVVRLNNATPGSEAVAIYG